MGALLSVITTLSPASRVEKQTAFPSSFAKDTSDIVPGSDRLPYWQVNVPEDQRLSKCPEFLKIRLKTENTNFKDGYPGISERDIDMIDLASGQFHEDTWEEVKGLIDTDIIDHFRRGPAEHRRYLAYKYYIIQAYGSLETFVRNKRLKWTDLTPTGALFANPDDIKIIYNDWPYGIDSRIVHLCVWTKFELPDDEKTKRLTPEARQAIDDYVEKVFRKRVPADHVRWFKNWAALKSIKKMEHFHVMLFDPDMDFVREITNGDSPLSLSTI